MQAADEAAAAAPAPSESSSSAAAGEAGEAGEEGAASRLGARVPYEGERHLGRDFYSKRFRLLLNHVVESGPPLTEPALLHDQQVGGNNSGFMCRWRARLRLTDGWMVDGWSDR